MFGFGKPQFSLETTRCVLRLPVQDDYVAWAQLRKANEDFLAAWEPIWGHDHFAKSAFQARVHWAKKSFEEDRAVPLLIFSRSDQRLLGGITLDNVRRGPVQSASLGYWIGQEFARQGYMQEAVQAVVAYAFSKLDLSRIEAATLPKNKPSRGLLEKCGFKYEGVAQSYLQIGGRWRSHVLYANLRHDRRGVTSAGIY